MVKCFRSKQSRLLVYPLKSRKLDFFRINPTAVVRSGLHRLVRHGFISSVAEKPEDNPNKFIANGFSVHWAQTRFKDNGIHVGITVATKTVSKFATIRNHVRRRLRAIINSDIRKYKVCGFDFVFTAHSTILNIPYEKLVEEFNRAMVFIERRVRYSRLENKMAAIMDSL